MTSNSLTVLTSVINKIRIHFRNSINSVYFYCYRVLAEEWERREELERLQEEQNKMLEEERLKRKKFEMLQAEKEAQYRGYICF